MIDPHAVLRTVAHISDAPSPTSDGLVANDGFSGTALMELLTRLTALLCDEHNTYTEVGVYRGLTLSTVASRTEAPCVGIDDFSLFNADASNRATVERRLTEAGCTNVTIADMDFEIALRGWRGLGHGADAIGVLFIDGAHDYRSQLVGLLLGRPAMRDGGVIVVDDANYAHVRQASYDFMAAFPDWALVAEITTVGHPDVVTPEQHAAARAGWWNGVHVLQHDPANVVPRLAPECVDLHPHIASHDIFRHRFGRAALAALEGYVRAEAQLPDRDAAGACALEVLNRLIADAGDRAPTQNTETSGQVLVRVAGRSASGPAAREG